MVYDKEICSVKNNIKHIDELFVINRKIIVIFLFIVLIRLWLVDTFQLMATDTPHDDYLFIKTAGHILNGEWLGPYNHLTLIKGPVYPLFIAFSYLLGMPLLFSEQIFYSIACFIAIYSLKPICNNKYIFIISFIFILFNPFLYNYPLPGRVLRESFSISLILIVFSSILGAIGYIKYSSRVFFVWVLIFSFSLSSVWYTREEGIWLLPPIVIFILLFVFNKTGKKIAFNKKVIIFTVPFFVFLLFSFVFMSLNKSYYGFFIINELKTKEFISAYGGLMNVKQDAFRPYVPVSNDVLNKVYDVSPSFKELQPFFGKARLLPGRTQWPPSFFIWEIREAVNGAGYSTDLDTALKFYRNIGNDIKNACDAGRLSCISRGASLQPPWFSVYNYRALKEFGKILINSIGFKNFNTSLGQIEKRHSTSNLKILLDYSKVVHDKILPYRGQKNKKYPDYYQKMRIEKIRILEDIGNSYKLIVPVLFAFSIIINFINGKKIQIFMDTSPLIFAGIIIIVGIISLAIVLTFVSVTLWPIKRPLYSIYPLILLYIILQINFFNIKNRSLCHFFLKTKNFLNK